MDVPADSFDDATEACTRPAGRSAHGARAFAAAWRVPRPASAPVQRAPGWAHQRLHVWCRDDGQGWQGIPHPLPGSDAINSPVCLFKCVSWLLSEAWRGAVDAGLVWWIS